METMTIQVGQKVTKVPHRFVDAVTLEVFLPSRGIRKVTAFFDSRDIAAAEISDVALAHEETDPRCGKGYELDADEQSRADEAAGDVVDALMAKLGALVTRQGYTFNTPVLEAVAMAYAAEVAAHEAQTQAWAALHGEGTGTHLLSAMPAAERMLETYVERALDEAVLEQGAKAREQQAEHAHGDTRPSGSEAGYSGRLLDAATLATLVTP